MKNILKNIGLFILNNIVGLILGMIAFGIFSIARADQVSFILSAEDVTYDNTNSGSSYTNVKSAIDDLDAKADALLNPFADYASFAVGDTVTINGDGYHVIASSGHDQDYVTLLKDNPLTVSEVNTYGTGHINQYASSSQGTVYDSNGYGGIAYYTSVDCGYGTGSNSTSSGCTTSYDASEVKYVVDNWATAKFTQGELKTVDGYTARLIKFNEFENLGYEWGSTCDNCDTKWNKTDNTPTWVYNSQYFYWTMSQYNNSDSMIWYVNGNGYIRSDYVRYTNGTVRPVINLYKSKIPSN